MINDFLRNILYKLYIWRKPKKVDSVEQDSDYVSNSHGSTSDNSEENFITKGFNGTLDVEVALLLEDKNVVLNVDYDFIDMPTWVEANSLNGVLSVVQMGGDIANLKLSLPIKDKEQWSELKRIVLVTKFDNEKLMHYLSFITQK